MVLARFRRAGVVEECVGLATGFGVRQALLASVVLHLSLGVLADWALNSAQTLQPLGSPHSKVRLSARIATQSGHLASGAEVKPKSELRRRSGAKPLTNQGCESCAKVNVAPVTESGSSTRGVAESPLPEPLASAETPKGTAAAKYSVYEVMSDALIGLAVRIDPMIDWRLPDELHRRVFALSDLSIEFPVSLAASPRSALAVLFISDTGALHDIQVFGEYRELNEPIEAALRPMQFEPGEIAGRPVASMLLIRFDVF